MIQNISPFLISLQSPDQLVLTKFGRREQYPIAVDGILIETRLINVIFDWKEAAVGNRPLINFVSNWRNAGILKTYCSIDVIYVFQEYPQEKTSVYIWNRAEK